MSAAPTLSDLVAEGCAAVSIPEARPVFVGGGETAFLLLHGWGASADSLRFLVRGLALGGCSVLAPTLPGHGTSAAAMTGTGPLDWIAAARRALLSLSGRYGRVHVLGVSMGGALALQLAAVEPGRLSGVVTVNAPLFLGSPAFALDALSGPPDGMLPAWAGSRFVGPPVAEVSYPQRSRKSGVDLLAVAALAREALPRVTAPLLVLQSVLDDVVPKENADAIVAGAGSPSKRLVWLRRSFHVSQLDVDRDDIVRAALDFARDPTRNTTAV